jgi:hypothetical protein
MSLVLFIGSGITMMILVLHKHMEITYGKGLILKGFAHRADGRVRTIIHTTHKVVPFFRRRYVARFIHMGIIVVLRAMIATWKWTGSISHTIARTFSKNEPKVLGEGASMYIKQITKDKDAGDKK